MLSRGVVGKRITRIEQGPFREACRPADSAVFYIELEDGTRLYPYTIETEGRWSP